jgi:flagellar hook-associated protein 2
MAQNAVYGINSNLDTQDIINKMVSLESRSMDLVEAKKQIEQQKLASFQELKNKLQTFKSVVTKLNTESRFIVNKSIFSNNSYSDSNKVVDITTTSSASSGTYSLIVNNLATESKLITRGYEKTTSPILTNSNKNASGAVTIVIGSASSTVTINSTNNSLDGLRLAINNLGIDIKASFLNDGDKTKPYRLLISGTQTGSSGAVTMSTNISSGSVTMGFETTQKAQNASLSLDGVSIAKSSNTVSDVINGAALKLQAAGSGTISLSTDTDSITTKVSDFVDEYNELSLYLKSQLALDPESGETGVLFGNFAVQHLQQTLRSSISTGITGTNGSFSYLSQIGITTQADGTLILDTDKLSSAVVKDIKNVSQLFSSNGSTTNSSVTFVGFTRDTVPGAYDLKVSNGVTQLSNSGASTFVNASGSGNFWAGSSGDSTGLNFRVSDLTDGSYGKIILSVGVAEILNRQLVNMVDTSLNGPLVTELDTIKETVDDFNITLLEQAERLLNFEESLKERFANLEVVLGRLNAQKDTFNSSLQGIQDIFKSRK